MWCWLLCVANFLATLIGWAVLISIILKIVLGPETVQSYYHSFFAHFYSRVADAELRGLLESTKDTVFSTLKEVKSADPEMAKKGALRLLEIGVGCGANMKYYPAGSQLISVDPNEAFEAYFRRDCEQSARHLQQPLRFVAEDGEDMKSVEDSSVDAVVVTLVLCSVQNIQRVLREVRRVLVPGGRFYYVEHVAAPQGTWARRLQNILSISGFWPLVFDNCELNRETGKYLEQAGFSKVDHKVITVAVDGQKPSQVLNPFVCGVATK